MAIYLGDEKVGVSLAVDVVSDKLMSLVTKSISTVTASDLRGATVIGSYAFYNCKKLTSITIPDSVTSIGTSAFYNCTRLTSVTIPDSVTSIGNDAFSYCTRLTSVTIGNGVMSIDSSAFYNCTSLTSVCYTGDIASWCRITFNGTSSNPLGYAHNLYINNELVTDLVIPSTVIEIKKYAFDGCSGLTSATIPDTVTSIGLSAFSGCSGLTSVTINATTPPILSNSNAFNNTNNCPIYVPDESVDAYKTANKWSSLADRIQSIQE